MLFKEVVMHVDANLHEQRHLKLLYTVVSAHDLGSVNSTAFYVAS